MATVPQNRWCFHVFRLKAEHGLLTILVRIGRYISLYHTPLRQFSKPDCSATKNVPRPNDPSSESSREDAYNADLCGTVWCRHFSNCRGDIDHGTSTQGGVILIVWYARYTVRIVSWYRNRTVPNIHRIRCRYAIPKPDEKKWVRCRCYTDS